jgi:integrase
VVETADDAEALEGVSWKDVDLTAGTVRVRGTKTRSADRTSSLSAELVACLERRAWEWGGLASCSARRASGACAVGLAR